ncbi:Helix-turn-helix domain protein [uncultured archaeon]|nr:Helix-turn-helix domain protein [uncultured archaeon]
MPRGKKIIIDRKIDDEFVDRLKTMNLDKIKDTYENRQSSISASLGNVYNEAQKLYQKKELNDDVLEKKGMYTIQNAYELLRQNGFDISFRAFGGRVERGTITSVKVGKKRYIPIDALNTLMNIRDEFFSVKDEFETYKKVNGKINYSALIRRVENKSNQSVKIGTKRLIPRDAVDALTHVAKSYYTVSQAISQLHKSGIGIKRNAFERRLDRNRIPHVKIAGRRFIPNDVLDELVDKEIALREKK